MKNRNLLSIKKLAVLGICVSFVAGGCGKMTESSIPKLEEPVALNEAYRPVEYGTIGSLQVLMATAVPRDYCNYYSANVNISQIYVEPGDTVNVGDVLAVCDVDEAVECLKSDDFIREILGEHIYNKYIEAKEAEWNDYRAAVTQWEIDEYLYKF